MKYFYLTLFKTDHYQKKDGVAILEFASEKDKNEAWQMLAYQNVIEDEKKFLKDDAAGVHVFYVDEEVKVI